MATNNRITLLGEIFNFLCEVVVLMRTSACCSTRQDDVVVVHVTSDFSSVIETPFKTEFLVTLFKRYRNLMNNTLVLEFSDA